MKEKVIGIVLFILVIFIMFVIISSSITINKYTKIGNNIDKQINDTKKNIQVKENEYKKLKEENKTKSKQLENMNSYIDALKEKVEEYEK